MNEINMLRTFDGRRALVDTCYERQCRVCDHVVARARIPLEDELMFGHLHHVYRAHDLSSR